MTILLLFIVFVVVFVISGMKSYVLRDFIEELYEIDEILNGRW